MKNSKSYIAVFKLFGTETQYLRARLHETRVNSNRFKISNRFEMSFRFTSVNFQIDRSEICTEVSFTTPEVM